MIPRFTDKKSQRQIAAFRTYEIVAARVHNDANAARWNDQLKTQWELAHMGKVVSLRDELTEAVRVGDFEKAKRLTRICLRESPNGDAQKNAPPQAGLT